MTTLPLPSLMKTAPREGSWATMLRDRWVAMVAIVTAGLVTIGLLGGLVVLAVKGADATQIMAAVSLILNAVLLARLEATRSTVATIQQQTNGTQTQLIQAAINSQPPPQS